ncbi:hypothetical protein C1X49_10150 [Pseudomonas sp. MPR-E5]|jgi:hypothetical protein|nr:hypothetical protein BOO94_15080 [Pseudomonas sp. FSL W5-0299]PMV90429.1 hypothetical protein C1X56_01110 [Pseudomonas sp. GW101-1A09]PMW44734.1 hypothetical protein C1X49_10150 [Pseudomonas sp. MPR-E5]PMW63196.1 hypothetical protein C1X39_02885 [Pseudomonas sp. GW456-12-1-14-TSB1]PMW92180.1 hypothetical protein C1X32_02105 [Pseudomonas sp. GW460-12-1-14-LB3]PMY34605.1 hypothetical protein C1X37_09715 [Pseudomonas sp. FW305-3-2-15-A-R2A1]
MRLRGRFQTTLVLERHDRIAIFWCDATFVGARLAGEGVLTIAFAGKPGSYKKKQKARWQYAKGP